jgi:Ca-activated chloride channel family protein
MIQFKDDNILFFLILLVPLVVALLLYLGWRKNVTASFAQDHLIHKLSPYRSTRRVIFKYFLAILAFAMIIIAAAQPITGAKVKNEKITGADVIFCIDLSSSMNAEDIEPSRLSRAKQVVVSMLRQLKNSNTGLVIFAGEAYIKVPVTPDKEIVKSQVKSLETSDIPGQGTALARALETALFAFPRNSEDEGQTARAIVLVTDGEDHEGNAVLQAQRLAENNINLFIIGIGKPGGAPVPVETSTGQIAYKKDFNGNPVISKLNDKMLIELANVSEGKFFKTINPAKAGNSIVSEIKKLDRKSSRITLFSEYLHVFQYLILPAILLLILDLLLPGMKRRRIYSKLSKTLSVNHKKAEK